MRNLSNWLRGAQFVVVTLGMSLAWAGVVFWLVSVWDANLTDNAVVYERVFVTDEGRPLVLSSVYGDFVQREEYRTLEGDRVDGQDAAMRNRELYPAVLGGVPHNSPSMLWWSQRLTMAGDMRGFPGSTTWFTIKQVDGRMYLEGFDDSSRARVGYIGRRGYRPTIPREEEWFELAADRSIYELVAGHCVQSVGARAVTEEDPDKIIPWRLYFVDDRSLVEVDLRQRSVKPILGDVDVLSLSLLSMAGEESAAESTTPDAPYAGQVERVILRLPDRLTLVDPRTGERDDFVLPERMRAAETLGVHGLGEQELFVQLGLVHASLARHIELVRINRAGQELATHDVQLAGWVQSSRRRAALETVVPIPAPAGWAAFVAAAPAMDAWSGLTSSYERALRELVSDVWPALLLVALAGVSAAWYVANQQRRFRRAHSTAWVVGTFLLGPMLAVLYWLQHRGEPRVACTSCGRLVPRTREQCAACGSTFPAPPLVGTEVFA